MSDRAVIFVRTADRLLEDRRVRRDALDAVGIDQRFQVALGDEAAGQEVEPDRLAVVFECFDGIHDGLFRSIWSVSGFRAAFWGEAGLSTQGWEGWRAEYGYHAGITPWISVRSLGFDPTQSRSQYDFMTAEGAAFGAGVRNGPAIAA